MKLANVRLNLLYLVFAFLTLCENLLSCFRAFPFIFAEKQSSFVKYAIKHSIPVLDYKFIYDVKEVNFSLVQTMKKHLLHDLSDEDLRQQIAVGNPKWSEGGKKHRRKG